MGKLSQCFEHWTELSCVHFFGILSILFTIEPINLRKSYCQVSSILFRIFVDHAAISNVQGPMQHLRWNSLLKKIWNSWKQLLTVVTKSFILNVTGLLGLTLKHRWTEIKTTKYSIQHFHVQNQQKNPKSSNNNSNNKKNNMRNVSNMFKVSNIDTRTFLASIVNFEHISHFILLLLLLNSNKSMLVGSENM